LSKIKIHKDQRYIEALVTNNHKLVQEIYNKFAPKIIGYICKNSGDTSDAHDVIQETLITIYDQAKTKGLQLTCPFDAYFFLLCKRRWLNILKKRGYKEVTIEEERLSISDDTSKQVEESQALEEKQNLYMAMFDKLGDTCKKLINLSFSSLSMNEIAEKLDISYAYARKKKSLCIGKLTQIIKDSPEYAVLKNRFML